MYFVVSDGNPIPGGVPPQAGDQVIYDSGEIEAVLGDPVWPAF